MNKKKVTSSQKRIAVPVLKLSRVCPIGTVHAKMDHMDDERTLGVSEFDPPKREIHIRFNAAHPGICSAAHSLNQETLNCYVAEMCLLGVERVRRETGDYPWPHDDWPEFLTVCDFLGRNIRSLPAVARSKSAKKAKRGNKKTVTTKPCEGLSEPTTRPQNTRITVGQSAALTESSHHKAVEAKPSNFWV